MMDATNSFDPQNLCQEIVRKRTIFFYKIEFYSGDNALNIQEIQKIAMLAKISLTRDQEAQMQQELTTLLEHFQHLQHAPVLSPGTQPPSLSASYNLPVPSALPQQPASSHSSDSLPVSSAPSDAPDMGPSIFLPFSPVAVSIINHNHLRLDEVQPGLTRESAMSNAAMKTDEFFIVPKVLDKEC